MILYPLAALAMAAALSTPQAQAADLPAPANMQGVWGWHGRCDIAAHRMTIRTRTLRMGNGPFEALSYDPVDKAIGWKEEGVVSNIVFGRQSNILILNTQGFHMPGEQGYARCGADLARVAWLPPAPAAVGSPKPH